MTDQLCCTVNIADAEQMHDFGVRLGELLRAGDLLLLTGDLGAGKTTLTRGIGEGLKVRGPITSPTFVLARTHPALDGGPQLIHVDAYRLQDSGELEDLDLDFQRSVVVAEWGAGLVDSAAVSAEIIIARKAVELAQDAPEAIFWDELETAQPRTATVKIYDRKLADRFIEAGLWPEKGFADER